MTGKGDKAKQKAARRARLSAALRENLKRRKAQARSRAQGPDRGREGRDAENAALSGASGAASSRLSP